ncbi:MAG TPA: DNA topoisomerase IB [Burkholderiales bacterium]|nr:DNA topoisomerase IB [Burkholderiales bacterium]
MALASGYAAMAQTEKQTARDAGLRYVTDAQRGIARRRSGRAFRYVAADGSAVRDAGTLARIRSLAIPPAWRAVWICASADGHIQATGRDARGRKQYRYHRRWREARDETKYDRVGAFVKALPRIRRRVRADLARPGLPREKILAAIVRLLETTFMRVGNEAYARENDSFGLTTLRERQVRISGDRLRFQFRGKSGVQHRIEVSDPSLARIVRRMQDLPGEELFQYVDEDGKQRLVESTDVNAYIRAAAGSDFTSKDFRTWAGTVLALRALIVGAPSENAAQAKRNIVEAVDRVSKQLGNTTAVCRKCYIHPAVLESYESGRLAGLRGRSAHAALLAVLRSARARTAERARRSGANGRSLAPLLARSLIARRRAAGARPAAAQP